LVGKIHSIVGVALKDGYYIELILSSNYFDKEITFTLNNHNYDEIEKLIDKCVLFVKIDLNKIFKLIDVDKFSDFLFLDENNKDFVDYIYSKIDSNVKKDYELFKKNYFNVYMN
jgi:hypothetical protein